MKSNSNINGNITNSQFTFLKPGAIKDPGDIPDGWVFEYRCGVNEYQKMQKKELLRIRKSSAALAGQVFYTYRGCKYLGAPTSLAEAVKLAEGPKRVRPRKTSKATPGMDREQPTAPKCTLPGKVPS